MKEFLEKYKGDLLKLGMVILAVSLIYFLVIRKFTGEEKKQENVSSSAAQLYDPDVDHSLEKKSKLDLYEEKKKEDYRKKMDQVRTDEFLSGAYAEDPEKENIDDTVSEDDQKKRELLLSHYGPDEPNQEPKVEKKKRSAASTRYVPTNRSEPAEVKEAEPKEESKPRTNQFFSVLDEGQLQQANSIYQINAVVQQSKDVVSGSRVELRITTDIEVDGHYIRRNTFLYGIAQPSNNRVNILINTIPTTSGDLKGEWFVLDAVDGNRGIYIEPDAVEQQGSERMSRGLLNSLQRNLPDAVRGATDVLEDKTVSNRRVAIQADHKVIITKR